MLWQLVKILAIAAAIFLAGRAFCFFLFLPAEKHPDDPRPGTAYAAMGTGAFLTLIAGGLLRAAGAYSVPAVLGGLSLIWVAALGWPAFRAGLSLRSLGSVSVVGWLLGAAAAWLLLLPETVYELSGSSIYLTQGFDLLIDGKDPSVWPYFGELYRLPFMYAEHVVAAVFALFSSGNHVLYYQYGEYWIDVLLAPLAPLGAYLFFRRYLPWWLSAVMALAFLLIVLEWRSISIRGEDLGWIVGFGFLLVFADLLASATEPDRTQFARAVLAGILFFTLVLTHSIVTMMVGLFALGLLGNALFRNRGDRVYWRQIVLAGLVAGATIAAAGGLYWVGYLQGYPDANIAGVPARAGEPDAAVLIRNQFDNTEGAPAPAVLAQGPLAPRSDVLQVAAFVPPALFLHQRSLSFSLASFPQEVIASARSMPLAERLGYAGLLALAILLFVRAGKGGSSGSGALFSCLFAGYFGLIVFTFTLNELSRSIFPLAAIQRTYVYGEYCFWGMVLLASARLTAPLLFLAMSGLSTRLRIPRWEGGMERLAAVLFLPLGLALTVLSVSPDLRRPSGLLDQIAAKLHLQRGQSPFLARVSETRAGRQDLFAMTEFVRAHAAVNEWVYSNVISDNQFWYLTDGRLSLAEGSALYQIYDLQRRAAEGLARWREFAHTAQPSLLAPYRVHYVVLYRQRACASAACTDYGFNVLPAEFSAFESNPAYALAYSNPSFLVFELDPTSR